jgi:hypothetical protein
VSNTGHERAETKLVEESEESTMARARATESRDNSTRQAESARETGEVEVVTLPRVVRLVGDRYRLKTKIDQLTEELKEVNDQLEHEARKRDGKFETEEAVVSLVTSHSASKIDKGKLLSLGVKASVIRKATVEGTEYSYVKVSEKKEAASSADVVRLA